MEMDRPDNPLLLRLRSILKFCFRSDYPPVADSKFYVFQD